MNRLKIFALFIVIVFFLTGCATKQTEISPDQSSIIKKIGIVVTQKDEKLQIFDHTGTMGKTYLGGSGGAIGALLEGLVLAVEANSIVSQSLGGDPDKLIPLMKGFEIKKLLINDLNKTLSETHEIIFYENKSTPPICDTIVEVDFLYGMAAFNTELASPAIKADVKILAESGKKNLLDTIIKSDHYYTNSKVIKEFEQNDAELYKKSIAEASNTFSYQIANALGIITKDKIPTNLPEGIHGWKASCSNPYTLTQDCSSWSGATRKIKIDEIEFSIAGSAEGNAILLMPNLSFSDSLSSAFFNGPGSKKTKAAKQSLKTVTSFLEEKGFKIIKTILMYTTDIEGYFLEVDGDAYAELKKHSL